MTSEESRRARNRRRWRRRRVRRISALLVMFPLMVGAGLLGTNVVEVLGAAPELAASDESVAQAAPATRERPVKRSGPRPSQTVPITIPVPQPYDVAKMRTISGNVVEQYVGTGSHISPRVQREMARLTRLASSDVRRVIVLQNRGVTPSHLATVNAVFRPVERYSIASASFEEQIRWQREDDYAELTPVGRAVASDTVAVPEPSTALLWLCGLTTLVARRRAMRRL